MLIIYTLLNLYMYKQSFKSTVTLMGSPLEKETEAQRD